MRLPTDLQLQLGPATRGVKRTFLETVDLLSAAQLAAVLPFHGVGEGEWEEEAGYRVSAPPAKRTKCVGSPGLAGPRPRVTNRRLPAGLSALLNTPVQASCRSQELDNCGESFESCRTIVEESWEQAVTMSHENIIELVLIDIVGDVMKIQEVNDRVAKIKNRLALLS